MVINLTGLLKMLQANIFGSPVGFISEKIISEKRKRIKQNAPQKICARAIFKGHFVLYREHMFSEPLHYFISAC